MAIFNLSCGVNYNYDGCSDDYNLKDLDYYDEFIERYKRCENEEELKKDFDNYIDSNFEDIYIDEMSIFEFENWLEDLFDKENVFEYFDDLLIN